MLSARTTSLIYAVIACITIAPGQGLIKLIEQDIPPSEILFIRGLMVSIALLSIYAVSGRLHRKNLKILNPGLFLLNAVLFSVGAVAFYKAILILDLAFITAIVMAGPILTVTLARAMFKERITPMQGTGLIIAFAGILICVFPHMEGQTNALLVGIGLALVRLFANASSTLINRYVSQRETIETYMLTANVLSVFIALIGLTYESWILPDMHTTLILAGFCAIQVINTWLAAIAVRTLSVALYSAIGNLRLPAAVITGWIMFAETPHVLFYPGATVLLLGVYLTTHTRTVQISSHTGQLPKHV